MKIATWNVNSLNVRLPHLLQWLATEQPDVVCLQETKLSDEAFPAAALAEAGYRALYAGQKTYNGVAVLARTGLLGELTGVATGIPGFADEQRRVLAASLDGLRVICLYVPNGQAVDSDKYRYKLAWLEALQAWLRAELAAHPRLVVLGDFNIAPEDRDVHDPAAWAGQVLCSDAEREHFRRLLNQGFKDAFRLFEQPERSFSWWDYRAAAFRRDLGLRIDHILLSAELAAACRNCRVDRLPRTWERPSDHAPVIAEIAP
jgi:exodeoxyribonuclease-3